MKTKNIFRMLLVAAALLLGANIVKATDYEYKKETFTGLSSTSIIRVNCIRTSDDYWQISFITSANTSPDFTDWNSNTWSGWEWGSALAYDSNNHRGFLLDDNHFDLKCTSSTVNKLTDNSLIISTSNLTVTGIEIVGGSIIEKQNSSIEFSGDIELTFGETFTPPTVTTTPANATVTYSTDSNGKKVVYISGDGSTVYPVGEGTATITGTFVGNDSYDGTSATYTLKVNKPTAPQGTVWNGAVWLGNFGGEGGSQPRFSIQDYFSGAQSGGSIRFYGKIGPLSPTYWKLEIVDPKWTDPRLFAVDANDYTTKTVGGNGFADGYIDIPVDQVNLNGISYIILNGNNLTITAIQMIAPNASVKQDVTLTFSRSTATATLGESFTAPTLTAASANVEVTNLNITYTSSNTNVATVGRTTGAITLVGAGTTTITASFAGNETYNQASASYTLNVNQPELSDDDFIPVYGLDYGYRTYVTPQAIDFSRSVGVEGYYATGLNTAGDAVILIQITSVCPVDVPLLLKAKDGATEYKLLKSSVTTASAPTDNKLVAGRTENGQGIEVIGNNKYVLTVHSNEVVFAEVDNQAAQVDATHAYLDLNGTSTNARGRLSIKLSSQGINTGISSIESDEQSLNRVIYNIRGQRVENPTKGLYIINGKKVLIK
jgi:hypothetical protein